MQHQLQPCLHTLQPGQLDRLVDVVAQEGVRHLETQHAQNLRHQAWVLAQRFDDPTHGDRRHGRSDVTDLQQLGDRGLVGLRMRLDQEAFIDFQLVRQHRRSEVGAPVLALDVLVRGLQVLLCDNVRPHSPVRVLPGAGDASHLVPEPLHRTCVVEHRLHPELVADHRLELFAAAERLDQLLVLGTDLRCDLLVRDRQT